jgi:hypothetical protein
MMSVEPFVGREWNHELAVFRRVQRPPAEFFGGPSWSALEASEGRDCKSGSIRWPRPRKAIPTSTCGRTWSYQLAQTGGFPMSEGRREKPRIARPFTQRAP